jgi:thimet oligopeptidase
MRLSKYLFLVVSSVFISPAFGQAPARNPLLIHSNNPIAFDKVDAKIIGEATAHVIELSNERLKNIISGVKPGAGPGSTLAAYDGMFYDINDLQMKLQLISSTYPSDSIRNAADKGNQELTDYQTSLTLNEPF